MKTWTTKDGQELKVREMETSHIQNCIKFMQRKLDSGDTTILIGEAPRSWEESDEGWWDEKDITNEIKGWIKRFTKELNIREGKEAKDDIILAEADDQREDRK